MFCPNCGNQMKEGAVFCSNCGYRNEGSSSKGLNFNFNKIPFVPILCLVVIVIVVLLVKNLFLSGSSFKGEKIVTNYSIEGEEPTVEESFRSEELVTNYSESTTIDNMETLSGSNFGSAKLVTNYSESTTIDNMETVKFGSYPQSDVSGNTKEPIEWIVLERQGDKELLLSKYTIDCKCYNDELKDVTWENCTLRNWINNDFYNSAFSSSEQNKIITTNVMNYNNNITYQPYYDYSIYDNKHIYEDGGNNTNDKIFCLSIDEVMKYFYQSDMVDSDNKRLATRGTSYAKTVNNHGYTLVVEDNNDWYGGNSYYWLRSPGYAQNYAACINYDGYLDLISVYVNDHTYGVRPALWVKN